jgi:hypothetical protein
MHTQRYLDNSGNFIQDVNIVHDDASAGLVNVEDDASVRRPLCAPVILMTMLSR